METICQFYISTLQCIAIQVVIELVPIEKWIQKSIKAPTQVVTLHQAGAELACI